MSVIPNAATSANVARAPNARGATDPSTPREQGVVVWLTGLSGAGKKVEVLDGDVVRTHLSKGLGFSREDRDTNVARIAFVASLLARNGVFVIVSAISPYRVTREAARATIGDFVEVHVAPPLEECIRRDTKGLYKKALAGEIPQFTGVTDPYEAPDAAEVTIDTSIIDLWASVDRVKTKLTELGYLDLRDLDDAGNGTNKNSV